MNTLSYCETVGEVVAQDERAIVVVYHYTDCDGVDFICIPTSWVVEMEELECLENSESQQESKKSKQLERLEELRKKHTNVNNCYVSVYAFNEGIDTKTVYDSAVITTLWFDFDHNTDISKCLKDVRKLYNRYCMPRNVKPRIFFTGGRGFQLNIDFPSPIDIPQELKRKSIT